MATTRELHTLRNKDFFDAEHYRFMLHDFEDIRFRRKVLKGKPDAETMALIKCEKQFESFYVKFLDL